MTTVPRLTLWLYRLAAFFTLTTVSLGSVVCATRSGFDCRSWPGCYDDRFAPGASDIPAVLEANPALEMVHRVIAMSTGGVLILAALASLALAGQGRLVRILPWVAAFAAGGSALFGRAAVLGIDITRWGSAADILCAFTSMSATLVAAVALGRGGGVRLARTPISKPAAVAFGLLVVVYLGGLFAAGYRSFTRCLSWPILWLASDDDLGLQIARSVLAVGVLGAIVVTVRATRGTALRLHGLVVAALTVGVLVLGAVYRFTDADGGLRGIAFSLTSVALLWTLLLLAARAGLVPGARRPDGSPAHEDALAAA